MTRRAAILACLLVPATKVFGKVLYGDAVFLRIEIPKPSGDYKDYKNYYALSVKYKDETINITPEELMKALREEK